MASVLSRDGVLRHLVCCSVVLYLLVCVRATASAQCTPVVAVAPSQSATLTIKTSDGSCTLVNGGYIKKSTIYKLHIDATVAGQCQTRVYQYPPGQCVDSTLQYRTIGTSTLKVDSVAWGSVAVNPSNTLTIQTYNTIPPTNTLSTGISYLTSTLGAHTYTSSTNAVQTLCTFTPASFAQDQAFTLKVVACQPNWSLFGNPEVIGHVPATAVHLYVPPGMLNRMVGSNTPADGPAALAVNDWNSQLNGTGVVMDIVDSDCGSGGDCIDLQTTTDPVDGCASLNTTSVNVTTGVFSGNSVISLPDSTWQDASDARLRRTVSHELGHALGLAHNGCATADSVMSIASSCTSAT